MTDQGSPTTFKKPENDGANAALSTPFIHNKSTVSSNDSGYCTPSPGSSRDGDSLIGSHYHRVKTTVTCAADRLRAAQPPIYPNNTDAGVNIIQQLIERNMWAALEKILDSLDGRDLTAMCCVCQIWRDTCLADVSANQRRKTCLKQIRLNRENLHKQAEMASKASLQRRPLRSSVNLVPESGNDAQPTQTNRNTVLQQRFEDVIKSLEPHERLDKCGKCGSPARVNKNTKKASCSLPGCQFEYCYVCRGPYSVPHRCSPVKLKLPCKGVTNRTTKWSLRRLLL